MLIWKICDFTIYLKKTAYDVPNTGYFLNALIKYAENVRSYIIFKNKFAFVVQKV